MTPPTRDRGRGRKGPVCEESVNRLDETVSPPPLMAPQAALDLTIALMTSLKAVMQTMITTQQANAYLSTRER